MTLDQVAKETPDRIVTLYFKGPQGTGTLSLPAKDAYKPNGSMRYFPPHDLSPVEMGWPVPYWYAEEVTGFRFPEGRR